MFSVKELVEIINKEKQKEEQTVKVRNLIIAVTAGVMAGAVITIITTPKSDSINNSFIKVKEDLSEVVETSKKKVADLFKDSKDKLEEEKNIIKEEKDKFETTNFEVQNK